MAKRKKLKGQTTIYKTGSPFKWGFQRVRFVT